jgi:hypothetical protein
MSKDMGPGMIDSDGVVILDATGDTNDEAAELFVRSDPFLNLPQGEFRVVRRTTNTYGNAVVFWEIA